ncbi:ribosome maturation factor RimM [Spiroplasma diminutum]|uniref:Ribosome maturation factor RimM n=1 Tax=Spiroplasma diminutum CUAS-1 TaxID=1276221 RepID=S5LZH0_9MOLU|nr:ribosome maturation factor RimM [Spiroplasma diminutum]AGR41986.1 16S rRNA processing protein rimM [Spiroplasma diminutum CUAS-1]
MLNNLKKIGKIVATHGLKGELKFKLEDNLVLIEDIQNEQLFLENTSKNLDVFEIKRSYFLNKKHIIGFEEINTIDQAQKLVNNIVYVRKDCKFIEEEFSYVGFECFYKDNFYGKVIEEMFNGAHDLIKVENNDKEIWIPCVDFYVEKIEEENKKLYLKEVEVLN